MRDLSEWERQQAAKLVGEVREALTSGDRKTRMQRQRELLRFGIYVCPTSRKVVRLREPREG